MIGLRRSTVAIIFCLFCLIGVPRLLVAEAVDTFSLSDVRLLPGPFKHAQDNDIRYLLLLDPDRLLAPYRQQAGMNNPGESYGNWEADGLGGHIGGHYLSALAMMYASTGNTDILKRLSYMITGLKECQDRQTEGHMKGYIGGVPDSEALWTEIKKGDIRVDNFSFNNRWVPWYNLHKVYAGLRDAYRYTGNPLAREVLVKFADWALRLTENLSDQQIQTMLKAEHGGINEVFADVAAITGDERYLELARRFSDQRILQPLLEKKDKLTNLHANTQIPKVIGFQRIAELSKTEAVKKNWSEAANFFWKTVVDHRTVAIGGNSVSEHFHSVNDFSGMINETDGPESCNTYNMLRLTRMLYEQNGTPDYVDYYERALYNHILSTQHPEHGGLVYFTSMRPQHHRVYSDPQKAMWCCVGTGIENHSKYGELIYAHRAKGKHNKYDALYVNLLIASKLDWRDQGVSVSLNTAFPDEESATLVFELSDKQQVAFDLKIRYPVWVKDKELKITVNGKSFKHRATPGSYVTLFRKWKNGDTVRIETPMHTALEQMPDQSQYYAVLHGPIVLAAKTQPFENEHLAYIADGSRMGHVAQGEMCPLGAAPVFVGDTDGFLDKIKPVPGESLVFTAPDLIDVPDPQVAKTMKLVPFFRVHDSRYIVYWPAVNKGELKALRNTLIEAERARLALDAITIDQVSPGEQQPEADHYFKGESSESGIFRGRRWRHTDQWFSYELKDPDKEAKILRVSYSGADSGRNFDILINDQKLVTVNTKVRDGVNFYTVDYPIPQSMLAEVLTVKFSAHKHSMAGGVYDVRLLTKSEGQE